MIFEGIRRRLRRETPQKVVAQPPVSALELLFGSKPAAKTSGLQPLPSFAPRELMLNFESLGDNCEFGFIQRQATAEPITLFRFSWVGMADLLAVLGSRLERLGDPSEVEVYINEAAQ